VVERDAARGDAPAPAEVATIEAESIDPPPSLQDPQTVAGQVLDALEERLGPRLTTALSEGRLWSAHGPELMRAWDAYRDALGSHADADVFREALRARWNVELGPGRASGGPA
jgi:hypothetical protein